MKLVLARVGARPNQNFLRVELHELLSLLTNVNGPQLQKEAADGPTTVLTESLPTKYSTGV